jgi:diacylglycerol kinase family enzyme
MNEVSLNAKVIAAQPADLMAALDAELPRDGGLVVAAGGDGTIRSVASRLLDTPHTLGILPLGTINHLARDLEIPLEMEAAARVLADGHDARIDVGEVNGEPFVNVCALGVYAELARLQQRRRRLHPHWPAPLRWLADTALALADVLRGWRLTDLRLRLDERTLERRVPLVVIANNSLPPLSGSRRLDRGRLAVYVPRSSRPLALAATLLRAFVLGPRRVERLAVYTTATAVLDGEHPARVVADGEALTLEPPLRVRSRPQALSVRVPAQEAADSDGFSEQR